MAIPIISKPGITTPTTIYTIRSVIVSPPGKAWNKLFLIKTIIIMPRFFRRRVNSIPADENVM
jgi:hypothetical protein